MDSDDEPALEVNHELTAKLPDDLLKRDLKHGKLGPPIIRHNSVYQVALDVATRRVYVGMEHGDVFYWDLRCYRNGLLYGRHSPHRIVGTHKGCVTAMCTLAPSSHVSMPLLVTGSADRTLMIWDPKRGNPVDPPVLVQTLYKHTGTVTHAMSYNSSLISCSIDRSIRLWRSSDGRQQLLYPAFEQVRVLVEMPAWVTSLSSRMEQFKAGKENSVYAADAQAHLIRIDAKRVVEHEGAASRSNDDEALEFSVETLPDGSGKADPMFAFKRVQDRGILLVSFNQDDSILLTSSWDNTLRVYDTTKDQLRSSFVNENGTVFTGIVYDAASKQVVTMDKHGYMGIYDPTQAAMLASKRLTTREVVSLQKVGENDVYMVATTHEVSFWKIERGVDYNIVRGGHCGPVVSLYTCTGGLGQVLGEVDLRVFSASMDNTIRLWDPMNLECLHVYTGNHSEMACMTFNEGWNILASGHERGEVVLWDVDTSTSITLTHHTNTVTCMEMAMLQNDVELLVTGSIDGTLGIWDIRTTPGLQGQKPHLVSRWPAHGTKGDRPGNANAILPSAISRPEIRCILYHSQLDLLLSGGNDCRIKAWDPSNNVLEGELLSHQEPVTCFASEGYFLFSGSEDGSILVWDLQTLSQDKPGSVVTSNEPVFALTGHYKAVTGLRILPVSGSLLSCGLDGQLIFWNYVDQVQLRTCVHADEMLCMDIRVNTNEILVGTQEADILRFDAGEALVECSESTRSASPSVAPLTLPPDHSFDGQPSAVSLQSTVV